MKTFFIIICVNLICFQCSCFATSNEGDGANYFNSSNSSINWKKMDVEDLFDYKKWKRDQYTKDNDNNWRTILREKKLVEPFGVVLDCIGECRVYRSEKYVKGQFKSKLKEGDEVVTVSDSYAWLFLIDGTLVRLSPESSISLLEINVGENEVFIYARINYGNVLWMSRSSEELDVIPDRETDTLFLPISVNKANPEIKRPQKLEDSDLLKLLDNSKGNKNQYVRLNKLIDENNKKFNIKKSYSFIVAPNFSILGRNLFTEFIVLPSSNSFFKNRSFSAFKSDYEEKNTVKAFYRGYENLSSLDVDFNNWYVVDKIGRSIIPGGSNFGKFYLGEYVTKRIPTILIAREMLIRKYSSILMNRKLSKDLLAKKMGMKLWGRIYGSKISDLERRIYYLLEYTRRVETTNISTSERFRQILTNRNISIKNYEYGPRFYLKARDNYLRKRELDSILNVKKLGNTLNSTKHFLWKRMHSGE